MSQQKQSWIKDCTERRLGLDASTDAGFQDSVPQIQTDWVVFPTLISSQSLFITFLRCLLTENTRTILD